MHFFEVGVSVERCVAAEEEVGYYADGPDVDRFSMAGFLKNFGSHVAGCSAGGGQDVELLLVHYSGETKVGYQEVGVIFWGAEEEVLRLEVAVDDAVVVEICDCGEGCTDQICSVGFVVGAFSADTVEEFTSQCEICDEVEVVQGFKVVHESEDVLMSHRHTF